MKIIRKDDIIRRDEIQHTLTEREVLAQLRCPFIVGLRWSFQTPSKLYLIIDYVNGGELFFHLQNCGKFNEERAKCYAAELAVALDFLHKRNIAYRDLKPENVLLDSNGHIILTDFGLAKKDLRDGQKTNTFCGTPEYLAPEVVMQDGYDKAIDWWAFGVLLYEMLDGLPPFYDRDVQRMYRHICEKTFQGPDNASDEAKDLIHRLLERNPAKRLGCGPLGSQEIFDHPFFKDLDWEQVRSRQMQPMFRPVVHSDEDIGNIDEEFTREAPVDSVPDHAPISETVQAQFKGFTYNGGDDFLTSSLPEFSSLQLSSNQEPGVDS